VDTLAEEDIPAEATLVEDTPAVAMVEAVTAAVIIAKPGYYETRAADCGACRSFCL